MDVNSSIVETDRWWESLKHPSVEKASMAKTWWENSCSYKKEIPTHATTDDRGATTLK